MKDSIKKVLSSFLSLTLSFSCFCTNAENVAVENRECISVVRNSGRLDTIKTFGSKIAAKAIEVVTNPKFVIPTAILGVLALVGNCGYSSPDSPNRNFIGESDAQADRYVGEKITLRGFANFHDNGYVFNNLEHFVNDKSYSTEEKYAFDQKVKDILLEMNSQGCQNDYKKAMFFHDYIRGHCTYYSYPNYALHNNAYACLIDSHSACNGISEAYSVLCNEAGIECKVIHGTAGDGKHIGRHAWNIVKINGQWYHVDVTWDLKRAHEYFMLTKQEILKNHTPDLKNSF